MAIEQFAHPIIFSHPIQNSGCSIGFATAGSEFVMVLQLRLRIYEFILGQDL